MSVTLNIDPLMEDVLDSNIRLLFVGLAHSPASIASGHFYAEKADQFYQLLFRSKLVDRSLNSKEDRALLQYRIGLTMLVKNRAIEFTTEIKPTDHSMGSLIRTVFTNTPKITCFNGLEVHTRFFDRHADYGLQKETIGDSQIFVVPDSNSDRSDLSFDEKLVYYRQLGKLRDTKDESAA